MPETKEAPERLWRTTNAYIYNGPTPEPCVEYIRLDLHDAAVARARAETWEKAIMLMHDVKRQASTDGGDEAVLNDRRRLVAALEAAARGKE